jgi:hypothetical protein
MSWLYIMQGSLVYRLDELVYSVLDDRGRTEHEAARLYEQGNCRTARSGLVHKSGPYGMQGKTLRHAE